MALVDYSDFDESGAEEVPTAKINQNNVKPTVQKLVDRSNPGKIRVSLPQAVPNDQSLEEPPAKRVKTSGGLFGGLASFLPPPKQTGVVGKGALSGNSKGRGLGAGVNLKTGASPGFSREPEPEQEYDSQEASTGTEDRGGKHATGLQLPPPKATDSVPKVEGEMKSAGKPMRFLPLSVSRKPPKKKKQPSSISNSTSTTVKTTATEHIESTIQDEDVKPKQKVSLFSYHTEERDTPTTYTSLTEEFHSINPRENPYLPKPPISEPEEPEIQYQPTAPASSSQSLDSIASDLNLSAAERRQLFGRQKGSKNIQAPNIINFNTDREYAHNQELIAKGEEVVHNPVRAVAPGKHSLKQLVNAAQTQKEALEDSFAKGKSNRAEASSRYGW